MKTTVLGTLAAVAATTAVECNKGGLLVGESVPVLLSSPGGAFVGTAQLQTSPDNVTWTNVGTAVTTAGTQIQEIKLSSWLRLNCSAYTSGNVAATAFGTIG